MKKILFILLLYLVGANQLMAQSIPETEGSPCANCVPTGYFPVQGSPGISTKNNLEGVHSQSFGDDNNFPYFTPFITLLESSTVKTTVGTTISGLTPGNFYELYYELGSFPWGEHDGPLQKSVVTITSGGIGTQSIGLSNNSYHWTNYRFVFKATAENATITFTGDPAESGAYLCLRVGKNAVFETVDPGPGPEQVALNKSIIFLNCPSLKADLSSTIGEPLPPNKTLLWFDNPDHSGLPVDDPNNVPAGEYYAFYYDNTTEWFDFEVSTAKVKVAIIEVALSKNSLGNFCPANSVNLNLTLQGQTAPENTILVWYSSSDHSNGTLIDNPSSVSTGGYYAFYFDVLNNCFNTDLSIAKVTVVVDECNNCKAGTNQVALTGIILKNECSEVNVNLNSMLSNSAPEGTVVAWFNNENHSGLAIKNPANITQSGSYYAFFYDSENNCFNTNLSTAHVTVTIEPCGTTCHGGLPQVQLTSSKLGIICPATTGDLNSKFTNTPPQGFELVWFTTDKPIGNPLAHPNAVVPGTYYAFFYNSQGDCFNVNKSTSLVTVASQGPCQTQVNVTAFLQGTMTATGEMRNDLQAAGLLPINDPYNSGASFANINNIAIAGKIVDWVQVELRKPDSPYDVIETKSLLLKSDGVVVQPDGSVPKFGQLIHDFRVTIRHRNHLLVLSNVIDENNNDAYSYDFSPAPEFAYSPDGLYQPQLASTNGKWSIWAGDCDQNGGIDITDHNRVKVASGKSLINVYDAADLNLDGKVDAADLALMQASNAKAAFSILSEN